MPKPQPQGPVVLRLVPPPLASVSEPQSPPALEILGEMEAKLSEWLHGNHLEDCESLRGACLEVLNRVNGFRALHVTEDPIEEEEKQEEKTQEEAVIERRSASTNSA